MDTCCLFSCLLGSEEFLRALTTVVGCGGCASAGRRNASQTLQCCASHAAQFECAVELMAKHCPCPRHGGAPDTKLASRMAEARAAMADGGTPSPPTVRRLWFALRDAQTDRAFARLRHVYPQRGDGAPRSAFSERPRRWARKAEVAGYVAPTVLEQEALAALVQAAGFGHPAADAPDAAEPAVESLAHGFAAESGTVPVADLTGRAVSTARREAPAVSLSTGDYLLRKLVEQVPRSAPERARTPDQRRRARLGVELAEVDAAELARRLSGTLLRLATRMPEHSALLERARGRARGAPYQPVPTAVPPAPASREERLAPFSARERAWLSGTVASLREHAHRSPTHFTVRPRAALERFLTLHLRAHPGTVPPRWSGALDSAEVRADLLDAMATAAEGARP